jgi:hypothetical protein
MRPFIEKGHHYLVNGIRVTSSIEAMMCIMECAERELFERGCAKINLMVRTSNEDVITYYANRGYARDDVIVLGKRLIKDEKK